MESKLIHILLRYLFLFIIFITPTNQLFAQSSEIDKNIKQIQNSTFPPDEQGEKASTNFFTSETGATIGWLATIASLIVGSIPLGLLFSERKKSRLLNEVLDQFAIKEKIEKQKMDVSASKADTEAALEKSKSELAVLTKDIEESVPLRARAAFYAAALPEIEMEILRLSEQRKSINEKLLETGYSEPSSSSIKNILDFEISSTVTARRKLDEKQTMLSIFSGFAAASAFMDVFGELGYIISLILCTIILWIAYDLGAQWALVYPETKAARILGSRFYKILPAILSLSLLSVMVIMTYLAFQSTRHTYY